MVSIGQLASQIDELDATLRGTGPSAALRDVFAALRLEEIVGSTRLAGARLDSVEVRALLERGRALGGHQLEDYVIVRGYAEASGWAVRRGAQPAPITAADLRTLHRLALGGSGAGAGAWRTQNLPPLADGTIPPPHWMVPFETETAVGRLALGESESAPLALARAIARLSRLRPFVSANGRVARLTAGLLAYRRGLPPLALDARARRSYAGALQAADGGELIPLARVVGRALVRGLERLRDAAGSPEDLLPLAAFAADRRVDRLYKAAQRGRLRVVRREGRLYTTLSWLAAARLEADTENT